MGDILLDVPFRGGMTFETILNDHTLRIDLDESEGGHDNGPRPKALMLFSLAGCTGLDVVSLLNKMRVAFSDFSIEIKAHQTEEHPKIYDRVHLTYRIRIAEEDQARMQKAVDLSQEKYCGVSAMFRGFSELTYSIDYL